jgi:glutamate synthase domain-containing protein 1
MIRFRVVSRDMLGRGAAHTARGPGEDAGVERDDVTDDHQMSGGMSGEMSPVTDPGLPPAQGLYDPAHEHDACGVGFVVDIKGRKSHAIVSQALTVLKNLLHRGACGCEVNTGDGAGILIQMPHRFLERECGRLGITLPAPGHYGAGLVFLPRGAADRDACRAILERLVADEGQVVLGWRPVPTDSSPIGPTARSVEPVVEQVFIARGPAVPDRATFERKLYIIRKRAEHAVRNSEIGERKYFYLPSLSANTLVYKGMLSADQIEGMFPDVTDPVVESALALVHQRFSTNTFPSWPLAHPYRFIAHNGEINTLRGNINWSRAAATRRSSTTCSSSWSWRVGPCPWPCS